MSLIEEAGILQLDADIEMIDESAGGWWVALVALAIAKMTGFASTITHMIVGSQPTPLISKLGDHLDKDAINQQIHASVLKVTDLKDQIDVLLNRVSVPGVMTADHKNIDDAIDQVISDVSNHGNGWLNNDHLHNITKEFGHIDHVLSHWHETVPAIVQQTFDAAKQKSDELIRLAKDGENIRSDAANAAQTAHNTASDSANQMTSEYAHNYTMTHHGVEVALMLLSFFVIFKLWQAIANSEGDSKLKSKSNIKNALSITPRIMRAFKKAVK